MVMEIILLFLYRLIQGHYEYMIIIDYASVFVELVAFSLIALAFFMAPASSDK